jgi:hypothetical protein
LAGLDACSCGVDLLTGSLEFAACFVSCLFDCGGTHVCVPVSLAFVTETGRRSSRHDGRGRGRKGFGERGQGPRGTRRGAILNLRFCPCDAALRGTWYLRIALICAA